MFTLLKPEMKRCVDALDPYLAKEGFKIDSRHPIKNWEETARELYAVQMRDPQFASEFNAYLWLTRNFFGNHALAYRLSRGASVEENLHDLMEVKGRFRRDISGKLDDPMGLMVNLERISAPQPIEIGKRGVIHIGDDPLQEGLFEGRWDYFFFKHIHTSDNPEAYKREEGVLKSRGVYDSAISDTQWRQMVETGTLTPLNGKVYKNG
jgi:hypothetical protein